MVAKSDNHTPEAALLKGLSWEIYPFLFSSRNPALTSDQKTQGRGKKPRQSLQEGKRTPLSTCRYMVLVAEAVVRYSFSISNDTEALDAFLALIDSLQ